MVIEPLTFESTPLEGVYVVHPKVIEDDRGFFMEVHRQDVFRDKFGPEFDFVQDNHSHSAKNVIRGLHFQWDPPMAKMMRVTQGAAFLVAVDIRKGSPALGQWFGIKANVDNKIQLLAPAGFARGFCALADNTDVQYKCTGAYNAECESGILWSDPAIGIEWPVKDPLLSPKDQAAQTLDQWLRRPESDHFHY
ncbi:MAG: dTDP-4-dehydrorhamnose 3,5-epimerase [Candidatus Marinimicrobia bacterium]|nr:dTDP-4-dehydrorhamnose 3,5-epimerase [Candidatus Neomarinimicrobiota bacterium]